jgi:hypothetical protein
MVYCLDLSTFHLVDLMIVDEVAPVNREKATDL